MQYHSESSLHFIFLDSGKRCFFFFSQHRISQKMVKDIYIRSPSIHNTTDSTNCTDSAKNKCIVLCVQPKLLKTLSPENTNPLWQKCNQKESIKIIWKMKTWEICIHLWTIPEHRMRHNSWNELFFVNYWPSIILVTKKTHNLHFFYRR